MTTLLNFEALVDENEESQSEIGIYRGWMLRPEQYDLLINASRAYRHGHWLPEWYNTLAGMTPRSVWMRTGPIVSIDAVMDLLKPFGDKPIIVRFR